MVHGTAKELWGKVVLELRTRGLSVLHSACGALSDVEVSQDKLVIKTTDEGVYNIIENNISKLVVVSKEVVGKLAELEYISPKENPELEALRKRLGEVITIK